MYGSTRQSSLHTMRNGLHTNVGVQNINNVRVCVCVRDPCACPCVCLRVRGVRARTSLATVDQCCPAVHSCWLTTKGLSLWLMTREVRPLLSPCATVPWLWMAPARTEKGGRRAHAGFRVPATLVSSHVLLPRVCHLPKLIPPLKSDLAPPSPILHFPLLSSTPLCLALLSLGTSRSCPHSRPGAGGWGGGGGLAQGS